MIDVCLMTGMAVAGAAIPAYIAVAQHRQRPARRAAPPWDPATLTGPQDWQPTGRTCTPGCPCGGGRWT